jgi:hypothetical protein
VRRLARIAALARIKELQEVSAALLRMKEGALEAKSAKAPRPEAAKMRARKSKDKRSRKGLRRSRG